MASVNKAILLGHLGKDPDVSFTASGQAVCNFSLATSESYKNKAGEKVETTEWHNVQAWGKLAEICGEYLKKGSSVYIEGRIQTRKWQDKEGNDRYTTEIVADKMQMLGGKSERSSSSGAGSSSGGSGSGGGDNGAGSKFEDDDFPF